MAGLPFDVNNIFSLQPEGFDSLCMEMFRYQYHANAVFKQWCDLMNATPTTVKTPEQIIPLPVGFFKTHTVMTEGPAPSFYFESSGTTGMQNSRHWVRDISVYENSFRTAFRQFYGNPKDWCILALLPAYLERSHSSLVYMAEDLIQSSQHPQSGFYLYNHAELDNVLTQQEQAKQPTLLLGVTFALLDFAAAFPRKLQHTVVMETGGMKGRRKEMTRAEVHEDLCAALGVPVIHAEYGMTELFSQAYSPGNGRFVCPPWMRIRVRDEEDPLHSCGQGRGIVQVIDLANVHSCAFIATEDVGQVHPDGSFEVWGRLDHSDIRGCSLLMA